MKRTDAINGLWIQWIPAPNQAWFLMWGDSEVLNVRSSKDEIKSIMEDLLRNTSGWKEWLERKDLI